MTDDPIERHRRRAAKAKRRAAELSSAPSQTVSPRAKQGPAPPKRVGAHSVSGPLVGAKAQNESGRRSYAAIALTGICTQPRSVLLRSGVGSPSGSSEAKARAKAPSQRVAFEPRQQLADAHVDAGAEPEVAGGRAVDVVAIGVRPFARIAVGRPEFERGTRNAGGRPARFGGLFHGGLSQASFRAKLRVGAARAQSPNFGLHAGTRRRPQPCATRRRAKLCRAAGDHRHKPIAIERQARQSTNLGDEANRRPRPFAGTVRVGQRSPSCRNAVPRRLRCATANNATPTTIKNQLGTSIIVYALVSIATRGYTIRDYTIRG